MADDVRTNVRTVQRAAASTHTTDPVAMVLVPKTLRIYLIKFFFALYHTFQKERGAQKKNSDKILQNG